MEAGLVIGLSVILIMLFSLLMERFKLPMVLGVLLAGAFFGPASPLKGVQIGPLDLSMFIIGDSGTVESFALLGSVLILFGIGLEFSFTKLAKMGISIMLASLILLGLTYIMGYLVASFMGLDTGAAVLMGLILSFSSTSIMLKILEASGKLSRPETAFIIGVVVVEDLVAVALLGILSSTGLSDNYAVAWSLFKVFVAFILAYLVLSRLVRWLLAMVDKSDELLVFFTVGMVLLVSYACEFFGLGFSVGSFLAGSAVASTLQAKRVETLIRPFNMLFASFFLFSIGLMVDAGTAWASLPFLIGMLLVAVVGKMVASAVAAYLIGFSGKSAAFAAAALLPGCELALLIGAFAVSHGLLPPGMVGLLALMIIITSLISVVLVGREGEVYNMGRDVLPSMVVRNMSNLRTTSIGMQRVVQENSRYDKILHKLPNVGAPAYTSHERLGRALSNAAVFGIGALLLLLAWQVFYPSAQNEPSTIYSVIFIGFFLLSALTLVNISSALRIYSRLLRTSGRGNLEAMVHICGLAFFFGVIFALWTGAIWLHEQPILILLLPCLMLGFVHVQSLAQRIRLVFISMRPMGRF